MTLKSPFTTQIERGAYSAIVFKDGDLDVAEDNVGKVLKESTNATTAIQAAIDSLPSEGGNVFFRAGTYVIPTPLNVTTEGVHFRGAGGRHGGSIISLADNANCTMINVSNKNFEIMQMELIGNKGNQVGSSIYGIYGHPEGASEALDLRIILTYFWNCKNAAVFSEGRYPYFFHSTFEYSDIGVHVKGNGAHIIGCWNYKCDTGFKLENSDFHLIDGCHMQQIGVSTEYGLVLQNSDFNILSGVNMNTTGVGVLIELSNYNVLQGLIIYSAEKEAVLFKGAVANTLESSIFRLASQAASNTYNSITLMSSGATHSRYNLFFGNIISNHSILAKYGISEEDTNQNHNFISNNMIDGAATAEVRVQGANTILTDILGHITKNASNSTGTGAQQTIAHSLEKAPTKVILWNIENGANPYQSASADATNIYITADNNLDYGWQAEI